MRADLLKKLDELIDRTISKHEDEYDYDAERAAWVALRDELAFERCENCRHWESLEVSERKERWTDDMDDPPVHPRQARPMWEGRENARCCAKLTDRNEKLRPVLGLVSTYDGTSRGGHVAEEAWTEPDFCCAYFTKKEPTS